MNAEAVAATRKFPVPLAVVMALARAADAAILLGRPDDARPLIVELVDTLRQLGTRRWAAEAHELAAIVLGDDQPDPAAVALGAAQRLRTALGPAGRGLGLISSGRGWRRGSGADCTALSLVGSLSSRTIKTLSRWKPRSPDKDRHTP